MNVRFLFLLFLLPLTSHSRVVPDEQVWVNLNAFINLKEKWELYLEAQPRIIAYSSKHGTTLYRGAIGKSVGRGFSLWLGYGFIERTNPTYLHEDRGFLQLMHATNLSENFRLINRTRFEARTFRHQHGSAFRPRHMLRGQYRFSGSRFGLVAYNEWFWNSSSHTPSGIREGFDQNRVFAGVSYAFGEKANHLGEVGYLNQYVNGRESDASNNVLAAQMTFRY